MADSLGMSAAGVELSPASPLTTPTKELSHALLSPPATEFPYPDSNSDDKSGNAAPKSSARSGTMPSASHTELAPGTERTDSETTLRESPMQAEGGADQGDIHLSFDGMQKVTSTPARPDMVARFMTDAPKPSARPILTTADRHSTTARQTAGLDPTSPESSDASSDEEEAFKARSKPEHNPLAKSRLNQIRRRPSKIREEDTGRSRFSIGNDQFRTRGRVAKDGRLNISVNETANSGYLAKALGATLKKHLQSQPEVEEKGEFQRQEKMRKPTRPVPRLNIVIMVIGSRGDIQPFLKIGKVLQDKFNHRVRIATHPTFKKFVEQDIGLEFFSVGGDPSELMAFMVKNPGLVPSMETMKTGEIGRRRDSMYEMFQGFWRACINATDDERDVANVKMMGDKHPFVADAIIANPPSFAHFHCAEKLGIPLHLVFTFPYTPTQDFPHPLANIKTSNVDREYTNYMSYPLVELVTWQGLGDLVNRFRVTTLGLEPVSTLWAPGQLSRLNVPTTYLWSPSLCPKPKDWGPEIDIAGYVFLDLASSFKPEDKLDSFLNAKSDKKMVYIGFGSISGIDDPSAFTKMIFDAVQKADVRAVVSKGWGLRDDVVDIPDNICMVDNVPHDWLFPKMDAVIHHGGAGTTAAGLAIGKPTMILPFFGDQPFWASMIVRAGAGAKEALPLKKLNVEKFAEGIKQCLSSEAKKNAEKIAKSISEEGDGAENAVESFHRSLPLDGKHSMRCRIFPERVAVWRLKHTDVMLSALAADLLVENNQLKWSDLCLPRTMEWQDFHGPGEPITGAGGALVSSFQEALHGLTSINENMKADLKKRDRKIRRRKKHIVATPENADARSKVKKFGFAKRRENSEAKEQEVGPNSVDGAALLSSKLSKLSDGESNMKPSTLSRATTGASLTEPASKPAVVSKDVAKGIGHSAKAVLEMPLETFVALTLGFRNAPRLYGDNTVRPPIDTITGFRSGLKAAGDEFFLGFYDGVAGLVRIPVADVKAGGIMALPKGVAKGIGGLVLKPVSGILGLGAYTGKGAQAGIRKRVRDTTRTERWIRRARMIQGAKDIRELEQSRSTSVIAGNKPDNQLARYRTQALNDWGSEGRDLVEEARRKEQRMSLVPTKVRTGHRRERPPVVKA
jgi:UDP:flavonoid glycosyltransferase YjiC (YdhE family)